ncbi:MAG: hypothetical protein AUK03_10375 [Anaerolineae bacterium CG2_30_64_16]|nr:MAG: hypothetical protein AUK03_10375 [Anaerolineae bacterium CG2_30_64_16]
MVNEQNFRGGETMRTPEGWPEILARNLPGFQIAGPPEQLSGGLLNHVWRVRGGPRSIPASVIVKQTPPHIASSPGVTLDPRRILIEAHALAAFEAGGSLAEVAALDVRPPRLLILDEPRHLLVIEDVCQCPDLEAWLHLPASNPAQAELLGASLGLFIGTLHGVTSQRPQLAQEFDNRKIQQMRLDFQYRAIRAYAERAGLPDADALGRRAVAFGELLQQPGVAVIMGDLWPRSVIVSDEGLRVIDWELAHYGRPAQDVGHLAAHLWMQAHRAADARVAAAADALLRSFLAAYRDALGPVFDSLFGAAGVFESSVHFGSEVLTRTTGVFQDGYLYSGLAPDHPAIQEAAIIAARHIREPLGVDTFDALGWR